MANTHVNWTICFQMDDVIRKIKAVSKICLTTRTLGFADTSGCLKVQSIHIVSILELNNSSI